jgi:AraC-like DNA-binding protein
MLIESKPLDLPDDRAVVLPQRASGSGAPVAMITIAHTSALVCAGLAATLWQWPEFDVRVGRGAANGLPRAFSEAAVHIILGDSFGVAQTVADEVPRPVRPRKKPKIILVTTGLDSPSVRAIGPIAVDMCLSVDCHPDELHAALRRLCCSLHPSQPGTRSPVAPRGGLAPGALRRVREHIHSRLSERIELNELAAIAGLSDCHFSRAFKQSMGIPPHRYVMQRRIEVAAVLIEQTDRPLSEIALEVGFSDQSHFTRMFSRLASQTPRDYRHERR